MGAKAQRRETTEILVREGISRELVDRFFTEEYVKDAPARMELYAQIQQRTTPEQYEAMTTSLNNILQRYQTARFFAALPR